MLLLALVTLFASPARSADPLPRQLIFAPTPIPSSGDNLSTELSFEAQVYRLPDRRRAEDYLLRAWFHINSRHALFLELHYVGLEDSTRINYGGGPMNLGWSWTPLDRPWLGIGSDVISDLPLGDRSFHPLSAKASTIEWRLRARPPTGEHVQIWGGWWARRVSPPDLREVPISYYPSGSGWFAMGNASWGRVMLTATARQDIGGLPPLTWLGASLGIRITDDLTLELGIDGQPLEPDHDARLFETGFRVAIHHRPRAIED